MRLLVISPSKVFWRGVHNALRGLKHTIVECESGVVGLKKLRNDPFDMVLLDSGLNEMSGLDFLEQYNVLVESGRRCPLLYFSAQASLDEVLQAVESGIDDFIVMPFDNEVLHKKLDRQVQRINDGKSKRCVEPGEESFVSQPDAVPLADLLPPDELEKPATVLAPPPEESEGEDDDDTEAKRRARYTRRTTVGV